MPTFLQEHIKVIFIPILVSTLQYKTSHPVSCSSSTFEAFHSDPCKHVKKKGDLEVYFLSNSFYKQFFLPKTIFETLFYWETG